MLGIERVYAPGPLDTNLSATPTLLDGTTVTAAGSAHTKGSWVQLIATTAYDWHGFWLATGSTFTSGTVTSQLLDIGVGGAGSETVLLPNVHSGWRANTDDTVDMFFVPLFIPKGSRVAARVQSAIASDTVLVLIAGQPGTSGLTQNIFTGCDDLGTVSASSRGELHTPGDTGTYSADASIGSPTTRSYGAVMLMMSPTSTSLNFRAYHFAIRLSSQTLGTYRCLTHTSEMICAVTPAGPSYMAVPSGSQLQTRATCSGVAQQMAVSLYGFY